MIDEWDRGPRNGRKHVCMHESADWILRLGRKVVIEARDLGVVYGDLVIGEGEDAYRVMLGVTGTDEARKGEDIDTVVCLREIEQRGREAAACMLEQLREAAES